MAVFCGWWRIDRSVHVNAFWHRTKMEAERKIFFELLPTPSHFYSWAKCIHMFSLPSTEAEDLGHDGPLAPGVVPSNCHADGPTLLKELNPKFVASASLGQVLGGVGAGDFLEGPSDGMLVRISGRFGKLVGVVVLLSEQFRRRQISARRRWKEEQWKGKWEQGVLRFLRWSPWAFFFLGFKHWPRCTAGACTTAGRWP